MSLQERATVQNPITSAFKGAAAFNAVSLTLYGIKCFLLEASRQNILAKDIFSENHLIKKQIPKRKKMFDAVKLICTHARVCVCVHIYVCSGQRRVASTCFLSYGLLKNGVYVHFSVFPIPCDNGRLPSLQHR